MEWRDELERVCTQTARPILLGPYRQEFGMELLWWIPFLRQCRQRWQIPTSRLCALTRGGAGVYYGVPKGVELYRLRSLRDVRTVNLHEWLAQRSLKQTTFTEFDRDVAAIAMRDLGEEHEVLPPSLMHAALNPVWQGKAAQEQILEWVTWTRLKPPPLPQGLTLPDGYTVTRWYSRATLPHTGHINLWARKVLRRLCDRGPVVLLEPPYVGDDHTNFSLADGAGQPFQHDNLIRLRDVITVDDGLAIQGAVIGRAQQYVGTHGGLAQLALLLGVPSVGYYATWEGVLPVHEDVCHRLARQAGVMYQTVRVDDEQRLRSIL